MVRSLVLSSAASTALIGTLLAQRPQGTIEITAAIVVQDLVVRPVPLLDLIIAPQAGTASDTPRVRTSLDGRASVIVPPGQYRVRGTRPVTVESRSYTWDVPVEVRPQETVRLELSNANASMDTAAQVPLPSRDWHPKWFCTSASAEECSRCRPVLAMARVSLLIALAG